MNHRLGTSSFLASFLTTTAATDSMPPRRGRITLQLGLLVLDQAHHLVRQYRPSVDRAGVGVLELFDAGGGEVVYRKEGFA
jgi:hypothetical protein